MRKIISVLLVLAVATFAFAGGQEEAGQPAAATAEAVSISDLVAGYFANMPSHIYKIPQAEFVQKVAAGSDMTIIDIRLADDYAAGHIIGAVNMAWGSSDLYELLPYVPADKPVMVYCYSGQTAGQAVMLFNLAGFDARSVNLGYKWGISKVEGMEQFVETTVNTFGSTMVTEIDPVVMEAYQGYYEEMATAGGTPFASNVLSEDNAKAIHDAGDEDVLFVSVRKPEDYADAHIEGAINVPFGKDMYDSFASLPMDKKLIVYCYTGQTAGQTVAALRLLGYDAVSLKGGMGMPANEPMGWMTKGYPTVASD